jgi:hypothetical protein
VSHGRFSATTLELLWYRIQGGATSRAWPVEPMNWTSMHSAKLQPDAASEGLLGLTPGVRGSLWRSRSAWHGLVVPQCGHRSG